MPVLPVKAYATETLSAIKKTPSNIGRFIARNFKPLVMIKKIHHIIKKIEVSVQSFFYNAKYSLMFWKPNDFKTPLHDLQSSASQWKYSIEKNIEEYEQKEQILRKESKKKSTSSPSTPVEIAVKKEHKEPTIEDPQIDAFTQEIKKTLRLATDILFTQPAVAESVASLGDQFISLPETISKSADWLMNQLGDEQFEPLFHAIGQTPSKQQYQKLKRDLSRLPYLILIDINDETKKQIKNNVQHSLYENIASNPSLKNHAEHILEWLFETNLEEDFDSWLQKKAMPDNCLELDEEKNRLLAFTMNHLRKEMTKGSVFNGFIKDSLITPNVDSFVQIMMRRVAELFESLKTSKDAERLHFSDLVDKLLIIFFNHAEKINLSLKKSSQMEADFELYKKRDVEKLTSLEKEGYKSLQNQLRMCNDNCFVTDISKETAKKYMVVKYFEDESQQIHPLMKKLHQHKIDQYNKGEKATVQQAAQSPKLDLNWPEEIQKSSEAMANRLFHLLFPKPKNGKPSLFFLWDGLKLPKAFEKAEKVIEEMAHLILKDKKYNKIETSIKNNFSIYRDLALEALQQLILDQLSQLIHQVIVLLSDRTFIENIHHEVLLPLINKLAITQMANLAIREHPELIVNEIEKYLSGNNESKLIEDKTILELHAKIKPENELILNADEVVLCIGDAIRTTMDRAKKEKETKPASLKTKQEIMAFLRTEQPPPTPQKGKASPSADTIPAEYVQLIDKLVFEISNWGKKTTLVTLRSFASDKINTEMVNLVNPYRSSHDKCFEEARCAVPLIATKDRISKQITAFFKENKPQQTINESEAENIQSKQRFTRAGNLSYTAQLLDETIKRTFITSNSLVKLLFNATILNQQSLVELLEDLTEKIWPPEPTMNVFLLMFDGILDHLEKAKTAV